MSSSGSEKKSKEIKFETRHVIKADQVVKNQRMMKLLYLIQTYGEISEKALNYLVYELKEKELDLGYGFLKIGNTITSKQLKDDVLALLYVDFLETVGRAKKFKVTSMGRESLEKTTLPEEDKEKIKKLVDEIRPKIASIDAEVELFHSTSKRGRF